MRIIYFSRDYTPHDHRFLAAIADGGHDVFYLRLERSSRMLETRPLPAGVRSVEWAGGEDSVHLPDYPRLLKSLKSVLDRIQPDLVHAGPVQSAALLVAMSGFQPLVTMSWGSDILLDSDRNAISRQATKFVLKRSSILLADCLAVRDRALSFGFPIGRVVVFPWGVDLEHFSPEEDLALRRSVGWQQDFVILHTRSWEPVYGVDVFARAFISAAEQRPDIKLIMLGDGSKGSELRRILANGGMLDRVVFPGHVSYDQLPSFYRSSDLYVSASRSDGSSISLLEAMACGLPTVVSDIPANREWVTTGENGWLFPDGDARALSDVLLDAAGRRSQLFDMGIESRRTAEKRADWRKNIETLLGAYDLAMERSQQKAPLS